MEIRINAIDCRGLSNIKVRPFKNESVIEACERIANAYVHGMARSVEFQIEIDGQPMTTSSGSIVKVWGRP